MPEIDKEKIISKIKSAMDEIHGSGLNYEYEWLVKGSNLILKTYYRVMNDYGYCLGIRDMLTDTIYYALQGN